MPWQGLASGVSVRPFGDGDTLVCDVEHAKRTVLYLHGGGYRFGSSALAVPFASRLAAAATVRVVCADYRLAPEHPFPAALHDTVRIYEKLAGEDVVVVGDSAGGGLAVALPLVAQQIGATAPAGLVLLSPWVDLRCESPTYDSRGATDQLFSRSAALAASDMYRQDHDADDPLVSPILGDLSSFPPTLLFAAGDEVLLGDSLALADRLVDAGARLQFVVEPGLQHVWPVLWPELAQSARALSIITSFLDSLRSSE